MRRYQPPAGEKGCGSAGVLAPDVTAFTSNFSMVLTGLLREAIKHVNQDARGAI
jgi:hypothetical protein